MGSSDGSTPQINEIAFFLNKYSPDLFAKIENLGDSYAHAIELGVIGGKEKTASTDENLIRIKAEILADALEPMITLSREKSDRIVAQLNRIKYVKFVTASISILSSSGVIGLIISGSKPLVQIILSLFAITLNSLNMFTEIILLKGKYKESDLHIYLKQIFGLCSYAEMTLKILRASLSSDIDIRQISEIVKDANGKFRELTELMSILGAL